jgi:hypothetical protein
MVSGKYWVAIDLGLDCQELASIERQDGDVLRLIVLLKQVVSEPDDQFGFLWIGF